MKYIILLIALLSNNEIFSQSISIKDLEKFIVQPILNSEKDLLDKSFMLSEHQVIGIDEIKTYSKALESIKLGKTWATKDGRRLNDVTYYTSDKVATVYLLSELKDAGFIYKSDEYSTEDKGRLIFLESDKYSAEVFITAEGDNLVKLVER